MRHRLGFAIAYQSDPDILIIDEGIAVGDQNFQKKSIAILDDLFKKGKTVIMASHIDYIIKLAKKIYILNEGRLNPTVLK
jgi:ABC-type polysaccharide/polyol phosphate transport system ATPase subunit